MRLTSTHLAPLMTRDLPSVTMMANAQPKSSTTTENSNNNDSRLTELASSLNAALKNLTSAEERLRHVLQVARQLSSSESKIVLTTSMGIHSALMLHLMTRAQSHHSNNDDENNKKVPVIWIDTGYLPPETYHFAEHCQQLFDLDLRTYQSVLSPARMEALYGSNLWEQSHQQYNYWRKVEPMQRALNELDVTMVVSGVRASQTKHRQQMEMVHVHHGRLKICPILDWSDHDVDAYFEAHHLPYHPLYEKGYRSVGDQHSSQPFDPTLHAHERDTRFHGRAQECGLHLSHEDDDDATREAPVVAGSSLWSVPSTETGFVLYTKPKCRFCRAAKALIGHLQQQQQQQPQPVGEDDDDEEHKSELQNGMSSPEFVVQEYQVGRDMPLHALELRLGGRTVTTVPQIWYENTYIGGYDNLVEWIAQVFPHLAGLLPNPDQLLLAAEEKALI